MLHQTFTRRILVTALALTLALVGIVGFAAHYADAGGVSIEHAYYSDAAHSQIAGVWFRTCSGGVYSSGPRTRFKETTYTPCS